MTKKKNENDGMKYDYQDAASFTRQVSSTCNPDEVLIDAFGDEFAEYRKDWYASSRFETTPKYPLELGFDILLACNLKCIGCAFSADAEDHIYSGYKKPLPLEKFKEIVTEGYRLGLRSVYFGFLSEPTINKNFMNYVKVAKEAGINEIWFSSNGTILSEDSLDELVDIGVSRVLFSIDAATEETYNKVRPGGDYNQLVSNLEYLIESRNRKGSKLPLIRLSFVVNSLNSDELDPFIAQWEGKADFFSIQHFESIDDRTDEFKLIKEDEKTVPENFTCPQPNQRLFVLSNGDVFPCCTFAHMYDDEMKVGNVFENSIGEIWNIQKMKDLRKDLKNGDFAKHKLCLKCAGRGS